MTNKPNKEFLDEMMETPEAARWLKIQPRQLLEASSDAKIPAAWLNERVVRFNPRTIIAKFAHEAGLPPEVISAMLCPIYKPTTSNTNTNEPTNQN